MASPKLSDSGRKVAAYLALALAVAIGFVIQGNDRKAAEDRSARDQAASDRKTCLASLDNRQQLADVIGQSISPDQAVDPNLSPEIRKLIEKAQEQQRLFLEKAQERFSKPLEICESLDPKIESRIVLKNSQGVALVPLAVGPNNEATTTTTTQPGVTTTQSAGRGPQGPPGPQGEQGPPGSSSSSPGGSGNEGTTTTTTQPQQPPPDQPLVTICVQRICLQ